MVADVLQRDAPPDTAYGPGFSSFSLGNAQGTPAGHPPATPDDPLGRRNRNHDWSGNPGAGGLSDVGFVAVGSTPS